MLELRAAYMPKGAALVPALNHVCFTVSLIEPLISCRVHSILGLICCWCSFPRVLLSLAGASTWSSPLLGSGDAVAGRSSPCGLRPRPKPPPHRVGLSARTHARRVYPFVPQAVSAVARSEWLSASTIHYCRSKLGGALTDGRRCSPPCGFVPTRG